MDLMTRDLLEREDERSALSALVARTAAGEGGVVIIEGPAGVGKTELLRAAAELGDAAGLTVLRGRGSELDRATAFGVVRQLLAREVAEDPALLTGGAEPAEPVLAPASDERPEGLLGSLEGLQWLIANLAARNPVVIVADDLHWWDRPSLRWLVFLAERIEDVSVLLVAATRPAEPGADQELLDALATAPLNHLLRPAPLSPAATLTIVRGRLPEAVEAFADACYRATGGNPFLLRELLLELAAEGRGGTSEEASEVLDFGSERVARAVRRRLRLQPPDALKLAQAVAVLGPAAPLAQAAELAGIDPDAAARAADALAAVDLLAADRALDFVHPVVAAAVYEQIPPHERQALHAAAAAALTSRGAEGEQVARHLLRLPPSGDPKLVGALRAAADEARSRGAPEAAANYLRRALEEPPGADERGPVLHELAVAEAADLQMGRFEQHFREALEATPDGEARGRIALDFGRALGSNGVFDECVQVHLEGLRGLEDPESELGIRLESEMIAIALYDSKWTDMAAEQCRRTRAQLEAGEELHPARLLTLVFPFSSSWGPARRAIELVDRILAVERFDETNSVMGAAIGNNLAYAGALSRAGDFYDAGIASAVRRGARITVGWQNVMRSTVSLWLGELRRAESEARIGHDLFNVRMGEPGWLWTVNSLAEVLVARGSLDEAEELLDALPFTHAVRVFSHAGVLVTRANIHLARGRSSLALQDATEAGRVLNPMIANPLPCQWRAAAAQALAALGRRDEAVAMAEQELADARKFELPLAEGGALRTLGLVTGGEDGLRLLRDSVATLESTEGRYSHARSVLELGSALRRAGERSEAREVLREALAMTSHMGASGLADRAHEELVAAGARPRRERRMLSGRESLTASEDRVAALAAEGLTNREIAQRLFVTVKAVQWHLRNVYRKLEVSSREELPAALELGA